MNAVISTLNNLVYDQKTRWADQASRLAALEQQVGSAVGQLQSIAATAERAAAGTEWMTARLGWWFVLSAATLLFAPAAASSLLAFVRRKESPLLKILGGAVACIISPASTGFQLVGSALLRCYRTLCGRAGTGEAPAPPPGPDVERGYGGSLCVGRGDLWSGGSSEFDEVDRRAAVGGRPAGISV